MRSFRNQKPIDTINLSNIIALRKRSMCITEISVNVPRGTIRFFEDEIPSFEEIYLPKYTNNTETSLGDTPLIRDACEMVTG